jgi:hypothetical protein
LLKNFAMVTTLIGTNDQTAVTKKLNLYLGDIAFIYLF